MADDGLTALEHELRAPAPVGLKSLSNDELLDLAAAVADARRRQAAALASAGDKALRHVPRILRGPIRKVIG